jgi:hypothetical protein
VRNVKQGKGVWTNSRGDRYVGDWVHDVREGTGTYTRRTGYIYEGEWKNGVMHGRGKEKIICFGCTWLACEGLFEEDEPVMEKATYVFPDGTRMPWTGREWSLISEKV